MKVMLSTAFAASSVVYCDSYEIADTLVLEDVFHVEFDNDYKWVFKDREIEINEHGIAVVSDQSGDDVVIEFRVTKPISEADIDVVSGALCACETGELV